MIEITLSMLPAVWVISIIPADLEPREKAYENLIGHMENFESSLREEPISMKREREDTPKDISTTSILGGKAD